MRRVDALEKVTGRANYAADYRADGLLVAMALRAPIGPGRISRIDVSRAKALPGIVDIFTHEDASRLGWRSSEEIDKLSAEWLGRLPMADLDPAQRAYRPLIDDQVLFAGQWIAVVVAESIEHARGGLMAISVAIEPSDSMASPPVYPGYFFASDMQFSKEYPNDAEAEAFAVSAVYETAMQLHQPMEPTATTAVWNDDRLTLYDSTQGVEASRAYVAASLGIPADRIRVLAPYVGGGFGSKNQMWPQQALPAHLARYLRRPVRMQLTRADMAVATGYRSETRQEIKLGADRKGRLTLLRHHSDVPTSLRGGFFEPCGLNSMVLYDAAKIEVSHAVQRRPIATPVPFRAPGEAPGSFALETALDELSWHIGVDPVELRISNLATKDPAHEREWSSNNLVECYKLGMHRFGWSERRPSPRSMVRNGRQVGHGMAATAYPAQALATSARVSLKQDTGRVLVETSATDIGTGLRTLIAEEVARQLQVDLRQVEVRLGDSALPSSLTAGRSRSTASVMPAVQAACNEFIRALDEVSPGANAPNVFARFERSGLPELSATGRSQGAPADAPFSFYSFGAHFVEVEIDERIGRLRVTRVVSALDCGRILNPKLAESQIIGSVTFGIGMALMEEAVRHPATGRVLSDNLADYAVPVQADIGSIEVLFVDKPDTRFSEIGAKGLGEIGVPGVAAAVGNALYHATGKRCRRLPISLDFLMRPLPAR